MRGLNQKLQDAKRRVRRAGRAAEAAIRSAAEGKAGAGTVNTVVRSNVEVRMNVGSDGETQEASAVQYAPIHQGREPD